MTFSEVTGILDTDGFGGYVADIETLLKALKRACPDGMTSAELESATGVSAIGIPKLFAWNGRVSKSIDSLTGSRSLPTTKWFYREDAEELTIRTQKNGPESKLRPRES